MKLILWIICNIKWMLLVSRFYTQFIMIKRAYSVTETSNFIQKSSFLICNLNEHPLLYYNLDTIFLHHSPINQIYHDCQLHKSRTQETVYNKIHKSKVTFAITITKCPDSNNSSYSTLSENLMNLTRITI